MSQALHTIIGKLRDLRETAGDAEVRAIRCLHDFPGEWGGCLKDIRRAADLTAAAGIALVDEAERVATAIEQRPTLKLTETSA